jgi:hypothetical protein
MRKLLEPMSTAAINWRCLDIVCSVFQVRR